MDKKGFELQFHWIFVLLAGALILAFFFGIAYKQRDVSQERLSLSLSSNMEGVFTGAIKGKGAAQVIPNPGVSFQCTQGCDCSFGIGRARRSFGEKSLFTLTSKSPSLVVWSREVKLPYRIANVLFVTDPQVKYYFVGEKTDPLFIQLTRAIPVFQTREGVVPAINYENKTSNAVFGIVAESEKVRFVFVNSELPASQLDASFRNIDTTAIKVDSRNIQSITFYEVGSDLKFGQGQIVARADLTSIFAAIFSSDATMYRCGMQSLGRKASIVAQVYHDRAEALKKYTGEQGFIQCPVLYDNIISSLESQAVFARSLAGSLSGESLAGLAQGKDLLESQNRALAEKNCPELF